MLVRSPRKLFLLSFLAFLFIAVVFFHERWGEEVRKANYGDYYRYITSHIPYTKSKPASSPSSHNEEPSNSSASHSHFGVEGQKVLPWDERARKGKSLVDGNLDEGRRRIQSVEGEGGWKEYLKGMMDWGRPSWGPHWPPFGAYVEREYDPNRWEEFPLDEGLYRATHDKLPVESRENSEVYDPFPDYHSRDYKKQWKGAFVSCVGPRGVRLNDSTDDQVFINRGVPEKAAKAFAGSYDVVGLDGDVCFDRFSRYGAYGFGDEKGVGEVLDWKAPAIIPEWEDVNWGALQDMCLRDNKERYDMGKSEQEIKMLRRVGTGIPSSENSWLPSLGYGNDNKQQTGVKTDVGIDNGKGIKDDFARAFEHGGMELNIKKRFALLDQQDEKKFHHRTAVLIRAWTGYKFEQNDIMAIRAMISELALASGGEYTVYLFLHVKDRSLDIFNDAALYQRVLEENVPEELRIITLLWSENIFPENWYPKVGDWQVYWQQFMCLQWFSLTHPEFEYVWNWETDARYVGHHYHFLESVGNWADEQPRKLLWERNKRFYIPSIHGSYKAFVEKTHEEVLYASSKSLIPAPVWGPRPWARAEPPQQPLGPEPPTSFEEDSFEWGVDEPADLITLLPIWDPRNTSWSYKDKIWNYIPGVHPVFTPQDGHADSFTHPDFVDMDRRVFINTVARFSKRMLLAMHNENLAGRSMQAEMFPASVALQHGLKAVYTPHPVFQDRIWPSEYAEAIFDAKGIVNETTGGLEEMVEGAWTEQQDSPYNHDREYNFQGWSWYFASKFPRKLYRRWLGWGIEWDEWGMQPRIVGGKGADGKREEGRMCLPAMLLHPVKKMEEERVRK